MSQQNVKFDPIVRSNTGSMTYTTGNQNGNDYQSNMRNSGVKLSDPQMIGLSANRYDIEKRQNNQQCSNGTGYGCSVSGGRKSYKKSKKTYKKTYKKSKKHRRK